MTVILIAEDEAQIAAFVRRGLEHAGYQTVVAEDGGDALRIALTGDVDLVLLDVGLPTMDGFEVLRRIREEDAALPVVMLTARTSTRDTVEGLDAGASDYIRKPFTFEELLARVRSRLRETARGSAGVLTRDDVSLDIRSRLAVVAGREVELSAREFALAEEFLRHPGEVLSRERLLSRVWGLDFDPGSNVVDVYVRYLRTKFGHERIATVRGVGYRWE
ncbi:response regulator transcription factor [Microbacterium sp. ASV49]|uniref:Response regulator transcription factor n=1 Tax=Microbacterium candidum TaxID=3041922 RepID=A0ABT7N270_9MICO|nr:response regulator transcription factor [Microbacterium sp. ASV49]MDL9980777.1 response regulator transcription factor [Microbacterium sp. ASV49]